MDQAYIEFIKSVLDLINLSCNMQEYKNVGEMDEYSKVFAEKEDLLRCNYEWIRKNELLDGLLVFLYEQYGDDDEVYLTLLDFVYSIVKDINFEVKYMERKLERGISDGTDALTLINLDMQIRSFSWQNNIKTYFDKQWTINEVLGEKLKEEINFYCDRIPLEERDENVIVIVTSQILSESHAPTKIVFDTCYRMKKILNKEVMIVNFAQCTNQKRLSASGVPVSNVFNIYEEYNGQMDYEYRGILIPMYQVPIDENYYSEIRSVLEFIYDLKPMCIWNVATLPAILGLTNQIATNVYVDCTQGYAPVKTDIFFNYFSNISHESKLNRKFLTEIGTVIVDEVLIKEKDKVQTALKKTDFNIPEDAFVICVAGNRLMNDCNSTYFEIIDKIITDNSRVHLMVIGKVSNEFVENCTVGLKNSENIHFIGYRSDFLECMSLMDLYVNNFSVGGGNAGVNALFLGKPVVTLNKGDIYSFVGDEFAVENIEGYIPVINRYINNEEFYNEKSALARKKYEKFSVGDEEIAKVLQRVLDKVR